MTNAQDFFREKKPWSRYKDLILDYYFEPYLAKVARLRRPILVVDCFAGPGKFDDEQPGSPFIISNRLEPVQERGTEVLAFYVEKDPILYERLSANMRGLNIPVRTKQGDFRQYTDEIAKLAQSHTVFLYLDPIRPSDLLFTDMESVYRQLQTGRSVEVLINFSSTGFLRAVRGLSEQVHKGGTLLPEHPLIVRWNAIAGGAYWQRIVYEGCSSDAQRINELAHAYADRLREWFKWVISYAVREKYENKFPKYHLTFGSRHPDAIELMNRAMVKARRKFVDTQFVNGFLFPNQPDSEVVRPEEVGEVVIHTSHSAGKVTWKTLRVRATIEHPCRYNESELNAAVKRAIQKGKIASDCPGHRVKEDAWIWPVNQM